MKQSRLFYVYLIIVLLVAFVVSSYVLKKHIYKLIYNINYDNYVIVCAKYKKNTDFLADIPIKSLILEKGDIIPNKANEASTYLWFIVENYDNLPNNTIFIHDENMSWHHRGKITDNIYGWINEYEKRGSTYHEVNHPICIKKEELYSNATYLKFWDDCMKPYFGDYYSVKSIPNSVCCAQFIISKEVIRHNPKSFYVNMYNWLISHTSGEGTGDAYNMYSSYNTGRYAEWSYRYIFNRAKIAP